MPGFNIPYTPEGCEAVAQAGIGPSHVQEFARVHRFLLEVLQPLGSQDDGLLLYLEKCNRPSVEYDKILIHSAQDEIPRPGKTHWKDVEFTFYEKVVELDGGNMENQCTKFIYDWHALGMIDIETSLHLSPAAYLKDCRLQMLDGSGEPIWTYHLYECWPMKVSPTDLDYGSSDIARTSVTLAYARAKERRRGGQ